MAGYPNYRSGGESGKEAADRICFHLGPPLTDNRIHWGLTPVALGLGGGLLGCFDAWL